jgi:hypothetical protein
MDRISNLSIPALFHSALYALRIAFPINKSTNEPAIATRNDVKLNPVTVIPKIRFAKNPPTSAPTIPKRIDPNIPPRLDMGSIAFATIPTIKPNNIQDNMFTLSPPFFCYAEI